MQPWRHAKMTTRGRDADWQDDLPIHEFVDSAKVACPDLRHRLVLHNSDLGVYLTNLAFPERTDCADIVCEHVHQDLGTVPTLTDWIMTAERPFRLNWRAPDDDTVVKEACETIGLDDEGPVRDVLSILTFAASLLADNEAFGRAILMNNFGPPLVRRLLGPARKIGTKDRTETVFDPSWVAEGIIVANFGQIPLLGDVLSPFTGHYQL